METLLSSIKEAMKDGASPETRRSGIAACKTILAALEASPGEPMAGGAPGAQTTPPGAAYQPFPSPHASVSPLEMVMAQLVAKLGSQNQNEPSEAAAKSPSGLRIPFVPMATVSPFKKGA